MTPNTETVASRINTGSKAKLEQAAEECDLTLSAYLEPVLEEHIKRNPNGLEALESCASGEPCETGMSQEDGSVNDLIEEMLEDLE